MRHAIASILSALVLFTAIPSIAGEADAVAKAKSAAVDWLALTDNAKYAESWQAAAAVFKAAISQGQWEQALRSVRSPLGVLRSRKVMSATFTRTLPGAPDGEYVVIQYETAFENKASAVETVTPMREKDGSWKVSGYYIK